MIRSLLVAYDGSHGARVALQHAVDVASRCNGRICLLSVGGPSETESLPAGEGQFDLTALAQEAEESGLDSAPAEVADEALSEAREVCRDLSVRCIARAAYGDVAMAVTRVARLSDLVFLARDGLGPSSQGGGSARTARRVAANSARPVAITPRQYEPVRSVLAVCPMSDEGARALGTASELASILQVQLETLAVTQSGVAAGTWVPQVKRYMIDHGHTGSVVVRKPPLGPQLASLLGGRKSPLVAVPRQGGLATLLRRDPLSSALQVLGATVLVQP